MKSYYVYIMSNQSRTLYVGVTNNLEHRVRQHKSKTIAGFTARYNCTWLVFYEAFSNVNESIEWEKRIKGWTRAKKLSLIDEMNPQFEDLASSWS